MMSVYLIGMELRRSMMVPSMMRQFVELELNKLVLAPSMMELELNRMELVQSMIVSKS